MKKIISIGIIGIFLLSGFTLPSAFGESSTGILNSGNILFVGGSGPGNYSKIQDAINDANSGDTVFVLAGNYYENIVIDESISLVGEHKSYTFIDGGGSGNVVKIEADNVSIGRFTIQNNGDEYNIDSVIQVTADNSFIYRNKIIVRKSGYGIYITDSCSSTIKDNIITKNETDYSYPSGIFLCRTFYTTISGNIISNFESKAISLESSYKNSITMNTISNNDEGIQLLASGSNYISDNLIDGNYDGITLDYSLHNNISINNFTNNQRGIYIKYSSSPHNKIYHNNFINNDKNTEDLSWMPTETYWDNGYPSGGNYWDDYIGEDNNGDGIGDEPYYFDIWGEDPKDNYPLMLPYSSNSHSNKIICDNSKITVYPHESAIYEIKVENTGNIIDSYNMELLGGKICIDVSLSDTELMLYPGENATVFLTVEPFCEIETNYFVVVSAESIGDPSDPAHGVLTNTTVILPPIVPDLKIVILQLGFGKVKVNIRNEGEENVNDHINWTISVRSDGIFNRINFSVNGTIESLDKNCLVTIKTPGQSVKHGLGRINAIVTISIQRAGGDTEKKSVLAIGFVIGRLIYFKFQRPIPPILE